MADVFISWSSEDRAFVNRLACRLEQEGFTVDEYSRDPNGGDIRHNVWEYVQDAQVALVCLSATSVAKPWITTEIDWCVARLMQTGKTPVIVPLLLDGVDPARISHLMANDAWQKRVTLPASPAEADIFKLLATVHALLPRRARRIIPAALFSLTRHEAETWLANTGSHASIKPLCQAVGLDWGPGVPPQLLSRYGETREDFSPFPGKPIKEMVQDALGLANRERADDPRKPQLGIWWCTDELLDSNHPDWPYATHLWEEGMSIVVVDSISILKREIDDRFSRLPQPNQPGFSALLWVPPYTLHTAALERITEDALRSINVLRRKFSHWGEKRNPPYLAFDIGTRPSLDRWLHDALSHSDVGLRPDPDAIRSVVSQAGRSRPLTEFLRGI